MQPGVEPVEVAKPSQVAPGEDEGLLNRIIGEIAVAQHELGNVEQATDRFGCEGCERIAIASACSLDQISPHGSPLVPRQHPPVSHYRDLGRSIGSILLNDYCLDY